MKTNSRFLFVASLVLAMAFLVSCPSDSGGGNPSKDSCIKTELEIKANTFDDVTKACNATRGEVLSQLPNSIGSCNKNELDFDKPIKDITKDCGVDEIPTVNPSSSSNGGSNPGTPDTYTLVSYNSNSFTYNGERYRCTDINGGTLTGDNETMGYSLYYSNGNYILVLGEKGDTIHFKGTSSNLMGTWTRTKDKNASCKLYTWTSCIDYDRDKCECREYKEYSSFDCKYHYDYTKLVFTQNTVAITRDYCRTDTMINEEVRDNGWKYKIINCDTYEMSKGAEKVTIISKEGTNWETWEGTYNGKTCKFSTPSVSQRAKACSDAWKAGNSGSKLEDAYYDILVKDMYKCLVDNNFPRESYREDGGNGGVEPIGCDIKGENKNEQHD